MGEQTTVTETKNSLTPQEIDLGNGQKMTADQIAKELEGKKKLHSDVQVAQGKAKQLETQIAEMRQQLQVLTGAQQRKEEEEYLKIPESEDEVDPFFKQLVSEHKKDREEIKVLRKELKEALGSVNADAIEEIQEQNVSKASEFMKANGITEPGEQKQFWEYALMHPTNKSKFGGRALVVSDKAIQDAYFLLRKDEIMQKAGATARTTTLDEIFKPRTHAVVVPGATGTDDPDLKTMSANWKTYTPEQRTKYLEKINKMARGQ